jgi:hypothetical protein
MRIRFFSSMDFNLVIASLPVISMVNVFISVIDFIIAEYLI